MAICDKVLDEDQIACVMKMSLQGLDYLHGLKKIHRDIKSGNILMTANGDCKLADFGVSAELTNTMSKRKTVIGTPYWMAPEVLQSADYDGKADIWSLAITAIELGAGEPPHASIHPMRAIFIIPNSEPPTMPDPSKWSPAFNDFLKVCLVKNPANRPNAKTLLTTHPFILSAKPKSLIGELVSECMERIDEYRKNDHDEDEGDEDDATKGQQTIKQAGAKGLSTMVTPSVDSGTMVSNAMPSGTMVGPGYASGTMVTGTMVSTPTKTNISSSEYGGYEVAKAKAAEPVKLSNIVKAETQARAQPAVKSDQKSEAKAEGKAPAVAQETLSKASAQELRNNLIALNKTYDEEVRQLESYYTQKRKQLQEFIAQKEKDMKSKGR
jgi:serine/threonine kinase 3